MGKTRAIAAIVLVLYTASCATAMAPPGHKPMILEMRHDPLPTTGSLVDNLWHRSKPEGAHPTVVMELTGHLDKAAVDKLDKELEWAVADGAQVAVLVINSPGGDVEEGFRLGDAIERARASLRVQCVVAEHAESMAFYILQACTDRAVVPSAHLTAHQPYYQILFISYAHWIDLAVKAMELKAHADRMAHYCAKRMGITKEEFDSHTAPPPGEQHDWNMDADEAVGNHAADRIVPSAGAMVKACQVRGCR